MRGRASISVSLSMRMSSFWMGPLTLRRSILSASLPWRTRHLTWTASPRVPVLPMTSSTRAGTAVLNLTAPAVGAALFSNFSPVTVCLSPLSLTSLTTFIDIVVHRFMCWF